MFGGYNIERVKSLYVPEPGQPSHSLSNVAGPSCGAETRLKPRSIFRRTMPLQVHPPFNLISEYLVTSASTTTNRPEID